MNGRAICTCPPGFTGGACDQDVDECSIGEEAFSELGRWGHIGPQVPTPAVPIPAGANPCEHLGKCVNTQGSFLCQCGRGYTGPRCETDVNECLSGPCRNQATCLDRIGQFTCICMAGTWWVWHGQGLWGLRGSCRQGTEVEHWWNCVWDGSLRD